MLAAAVLGGALVERSYDMPQWTNKGAADDAITVDPPLKMPATQQEAFNQKWFRQMDALRTSKWTVFDLGSGLIALAASVIAGVFVLKIKHASDVVRLQTPKSRWIILLTGVTAWIWFCHSMITGLWLDLGRVEFPPWADSIAIPILGITVGCAVGLLTLAPLAWFVALQRASLPVSLWLWRRNRWSWFFTTCAAISLLFTLDAIFDAFRHGPYEAIPPCLLMIYGILAARAAAVSQLKERAAPDTLTMPRTV